MEQSDKKKEINLPENLKSKLLRFKELKDQADSRRKQIQDQSDKEDLDKIEDEDKRS